MNEKNSIISIITLLIIISCTSTQSQIGQRFPSEKKVVKDPLTGVQLTFLTSTPVGDSKIYTRSGHPMANGSFSVQDVWNVK
jgi:oligogalacturonide lyase